MEFHQWDSVSWSIFYYFHTYLFQTPQRRMWIDFKNYGAISHLLVGFTFTPRGSWSDNVSCVDLYRVQQVIDWRGWWEGVGTTPTQQVEGVVGVQPWTCVNLVTLCRISTLIASCRVLIDLSNAAAANINCHPVWPWFSLVYIAHWSVLRVNQVHFILFSMLLFFLYTYLNENPFIPCTQFYLAITLPIVVKSAKTFSNRIL